VGPIVLAAVSLLLGAVLAITVPGHRARAWSALVTQAIATVLVMVAVLPVLRSGTPIEAAWAWPYPIELVQGRVDALSAFFLVWSLPMTLLGTVYALGYLEPYVKRGRDAGSHFALLNMTSLAFVLVYSVEHALVFLLGWEIAAVAAWLLVIWDYPNQKIRFAGFNYLVSTHVGMFVLVAAFMILHSESNSFDFAAFAPVLRQPGRMRDVTFVLLLVSFGLKSAFFPFHTWLPRAHSAAPAHVSALMSGVIHKAGLFALLRFILMLGTPEEWMGWLLIACSALSAVMGVLYTSTQRDLKRLLGYSSTENVGIIGIGIGVGVLGLAWHEPMLVLLGFTGGALHLLNHALFKCLLFYAAGAVYHVTHTVDIERLGGLARRMPWTAALFLVGGVAIAGLPPLNGFFSEFILYAGLLDGAVPAGLPRLMLGAVAAALAFVGAVSALAIVRAFGVTFLGQPRDERIHEAHEAPRLLVAPMVLHGAGVLLLGLWPAAGLWLVRETVRQFVVSDPMAATVLLPDVASTIAPVAFASLALVGVIGVLLVAARRSGREVARHVTWGCGYTAATARMQYTGASFSLPFSALFEGVMPRLRRESLPVGYFPADGHLSTHQVDAVERRIFQILGDGEQAVHQLRAKSPDVPRYAFGAGLVVLALIVGLAVLAR